MDDPPPLPFHTENTTDMDMTEYLKAARDEQWTADFQKRHGITGQHDATFTAEELYEAHSHHEEYGHTMC